MKTSTSSLMFRRPRITAPLVVAALMAGCLQTAPVVVVTPQDQAARLYYSCPNGRVLDVTRVQGNMTALVVVDGQTIQLPRDTATTSAERYTNKLQTLTLFGTSASFDVLGRPGSGPCTIGTAPTGVPGAPGTQQNEDRPPNTD